MKDEKPLILQKFGRYLLLDHVVDGGMAKICRARYLDGELDKVIAIKMIKEKFSKNAIFKTMFMDEIKLTFGLVHPNIAQTFDYGEMDGNLFTAMEYVEGKNLREYTDLLSIQKYMIPIEVSVYIMMQVCNALYYTHNKKNQLTGEKLNIIHRDISPHNIMITYDGVVKLIDFGIAKAKSNSTSTKVGTIKGKLTYIAPEYLDGVPLDHRYDQFAVGITLWELLVGRKLFSGNSDFEVLKNVQKCQIPLPSSLNPRVPQDLDRIVLKALSKNREERYTDMDQLNRALSKFLYEFYPQFNPSDVGIFAQKLFKKSIEEERKRFYEFGKLDISLYNQDDAVVHDNDFGMPTEIDDKINSALNKTSLNRAAPGVMKNTEVVMKKAVYKPTLNIYAYAAMICICLLSGIIFFKSNNNNSRSIATVDSSYNLILPNYDKNIHSVSINGVEVRPGPNGEIYASFTNKSVLKVQIDGHLDYITDLNFREDSFPVTIMIPETREAANAYLFASKSCGAGKLIFKINEYEPEQIVALPLRPNRRIAFPLKTDNNGVHYIATYNVGHQKPGQNFSTNLKLIASKKNLMVDICELLERGVNQ